LRGSDIEQYDPKAAATLQKKISAALKEIQCNFKTLEDHFKQIGTDKDTRPNRIKAKNTLRDASNQIRQTTLDIRKFSELRTDGNLNAKK
jgi:hypothetical protein